MIVGITGYAQHGKDTVGRRLVERWDFQRFALADQLREMALRLNPSVFVPNNEFDGTGTYWRLALLVKVAGWDGAKEYSEVRRILQTLGTECIREIVGEDSWVRALGKRIADYGHPENIVITDVRFPNEVDYIHHNGGVVVRVTRYEHVLTTALKGRAPYVSWQPFDNGLGADHLSEMWVPKLNADYDIFNGDVTDLHTQVDRIAANLERSVAGPPPETPSHAGAAYINDRLDCE